MLIQGMGIFVGDVTCDWYNYCIAKIYHVFIFYTPHNFYKRTSSSQKKKIGQTLIDLLDPSKT